MRIRAISNTSMDAASAREMEIDVVPLPAALAHCMLTHESMCIVKLTRRKVWLYNQGPNTPHWNHGKALQYGIVRAVYESAEVQRQREKMEQLVQAYSAGNSVWMQGASQTGKSAAKSILSGDMHTVQLVVDEYEQLTSSAEAFFTQRDFLATKREPWRKR